jgi:hypothetical protein
MHSIVPTMTMDTKKPALKSIHFWKEPAGITLSPACLASYLTWLQAGRLK